MLFSNPTGSNATPTTRKRRALPLADVTAAVLKSAKVPISAAEARESLEMLTKLCPFFLRPLNVTGDEWLEMPAPSSNTSEEGVEDGGERAEKTSKNPRKVMASPRKLTGSPGKLPASPSRTKEGSAVEVLTRSPRRVKREGGGLREVRERIRREIELQD